MHLLRTTVTLLGTTLSRHRYFVLCLLVFYKVAIHATNGLWYGDFWEHSAAVGALMADPSHPSHPLLAIDAPHAFLTPYHWLVAMLARLTGMDAINALALFGIVNYVLLVLGLYWFVRGFERQEPGRASFYGLLCILFLWGPQPWGYSGFLYFSLLGDVLPYASTFATALSFIALSVACGGLQVGRPWREIALVVLSAIVLLSHPLTFIFLATGLYCQCLQAGDTATMGRRAVLVTFIVGSASALALCWPYFPLIGLMTGAGDVFHPSNWLVYVDVIGRIWPILVLSPLLAGAIRQPGQRTILVHIAVLCLIYCLGYFSGKYSYGRCVTFIAILAQILIGDGIARLEGALAGSRPRTAYAALALAAIVLLAGATTWLYPTFTRSLTVVNSLRIGRPVSNQQMYGDLTFLPQSIRPGDVVLSDIETSWLVPTFGGKVIAGLHAQAFVSDHDTRADDLGRFFAPGTDVSARKRIIETYNPAFLLLDKRDVPEWQSIAAQFDSEPGSKCTAFENARYRLIRLDCVQQVPQ